MPTSSGAGFTRSGRLPMPDLLGPNQLRDHDSSVCWNQGCSEYTEKVPGCCYERLVDGECEDRYQVSDYGKAVATALLEALKAGGVKCKAVANLFLDESGENASWNMARSADGKRGHVIFIPEAQERTAQTLGSGLNTTVMARGSYGGPRVYVGCFRKIPLGREKPRSRGNQEGAGHDRGPG